MKIFFPSVSLIRSYNTCYTADKMREMIIMFKLNFIIIVRLSLHAP